MEDGVNGYLVAAGDPVSLAERIALVLSSEPRRRDMGARGKLKVLKDFTFAAQSALYQELFATLKRPATATGSAVEREFAAQPLHIGEDA